MAVGDSNVATMAIRAAARRRRRAGGHGLRAGLLTFALSAGALGLAGAPIAYMLWPMPAPISADAPSLPITVAGVAFNVPPAAIRVKMQRRPGAQSRLDLVFAWPSLSPPDRSVKPDPNAVIRHSDRLFITIAGADGTLPPAERLKMIYPRYVTGGSASHDGLTVQSFRPGSPYQGEDLIYDPAAPDRFLVRCTRPIGATPGMCLHERQIGGADLTARFPRDWLSDWHAVAGGIDRLITRLRPAGA
jgi:hypothetical protein